MRVFISYRRSDTGGRAGRLHDSLADRFGERNVFHDLSGLRPGAAFDEQIGERIAACDVVLVLIGGAWSNAADPEGVRRLDRPDDYVRREVREALTQGKRVVPVLVEEAQLPTATELPDDIAPLVRRQAFTLRDGSWQQDVRELVHGLDGDGDRRRPWTGIAAVAVMTVALGVGLAAVVVAALRDGDGSGSDDDVPACEADDGTWVAVTTGDEGASGAAIDVVVDGEPARFEARAARFRPEGVGSPIVVEVAVTSTAEPGSAGGLYLSEGILDALLVDGVEAEEVTCVSVVGDAQILPGRTAIGQVGYRSPVDPVGATIVLATDGGGTIPFGTG